MIILKNGVIKEDSGYMKSLAIYDNKTLLFSAVEPVKESDNRYDKYIESFNWAMTKLKALHSQGKLPEDANLVNVILNSKTLCKWVINGSSPKEYILALNDLLTSLEFIDLEFDFVGSPSLDLPKSAKKEEYSKINDMF